MKPIEFTQATKVLQKPSEMTDKECLPLHVWNDGKQCVSCWKPTMGERLKIALGGNVWVGVLSGVTQPPVFLSGENIFDKASIKTRILTFGYKVKESITVILKRIREGLKQPDKRKHISVGFAISFVIGIFLPWLGLLMACIAGAIKEWWDYKGHGTPEWMDFVFTYFGGTVALPFSYLFHGIIHALIDKL